MRRSSSPTKPPVVAGIVLIALGLLSLFAGGIPYGAQQESIEFGPFEATVGTEKSLSIPPVVGGIALVGGIFLLGMYAKQPKTA